jgi:GH35 family endo-1,4-beta-xylanase
MRIYRVLLVVVSLGIAAPSAMGKEAFSLLGSEGMGRFQVIDDRHIGQAKLFHLGDGKPNRWLISIQADRIDPWDVQLSTIVDRPVKANDVLLIRFRAKGSGQRESGEARAELALEQPEPFKRSFSFPFSAGPHWQTFSLPLRNAEELRTGSAFLRLRLGYAMQTIEIADLEVLNYGPLHDLDHLPRILPSYAGIEPDAPWRRAAQERIERYRKGTLKAVVVRSDGTPVPGARVDIRMTRQQFGFGTAATAARLGNDDLDRADNQQYRRTIERFFNMVTFENDLKWHRWENRDRRNVFRAFDWLEQRGIEVRGCCLICAAWHCLPKHLRISEADPLELRQRIESHLRDIVTATHHRIAHWDVVNEPYADHILMDILGRDVMVEWYKQVRRYDPSPVLYLNDYAGFMVGGEDSSHKQSFEETVRYLKTQGAPIGGLGIQAHFGWDLTPPERLISELDRWAKLDLKIAITEFDVDITDEVLQGQYVRDFLTAVFSHPACDSISIWGFWEKQHWQPNAALFRSDWSIKPAGQAWIDLVGKEWRTILNLTTNEFGLAEGRGFVGDYIVTATAGSSSVTQTVSLPRDGVQVLLQLAE